VYDVLMKFDVADGSDEPLAGVYAINPDLIFDN
jgi:hypothetical protein